MTSRTILATIAIASLGVVASAQDQRIEVSGTAGWTFSDGVSGAATDRFGNEFTRIDPADAFSWNARIGYLVNHNMEIGALFGMQGSSLDLSVANRNLGDPISIGNENIYNYHGYFAYNFGESSKVRPYVLFGLGATQFGGVSVDLSNIPVAVPVDRSQSSRTIGGSTKFSTVWALGVKAFPGRSVGVRFEGRWTPTYIKSDTAGWWCDPYWGCYTVGDAQYSNQFELGGGIVFRF